MIIDCYAADKFAVRELAERIGDKVIALSDLLQTNEYELFSEKPFVLALDYDFSFAIDIITRFLSTNFTGTKILYCVFAGECRSEKAAELALNVAKNKGMILFGADKINHLELTREQYFEKLDHMGDCIRNATPFAPFCRLDFPCGVKTVNQRTYIGAKQNK